MSKLNNYSQLLHTLTVANSLTAAKNNPLSNLKHTVPKFFPLWGPRSQLRDYPFCYSLPNQNKPPFHIGWLLATANSWLMPLHANCCFSYYTPPWSLDHSNNYGGGGLVILHWERVSSFSSVSTCAGKSLNVRRFILTSLLLENESSTLLVAESWSYADRRSLTWCGMPLTSTDLKAGNHSHFSCHKFGSTATLGWFQPHYI